MDKNQIQNPINVQNVIKLSKYQSKLATLTGGSSEKRNVYKYKINEYSDKLASNGVNVDRLKRLMQKGGVRVDDLLAELNRQKDEVIASIGSITMTGVAGNVALADRLTELAGAAQTAKDSHDSLVTKYDDAVKGLTKVRATAKVNSVLEREAALRRSGAAVTVDVPMDAAQQAQVDTINRLTGEINSAVDLDNDMLKGIAVGVLIDSILRVPSDLLLEQHYTDMSMSAASFIGTDYQDETTLIGAIQSHEKYTSSGAGHTHIDEVISRIPAAIITLAGRPGATAAAGTVP